MRDSGCVTGNPCAHTVSNEPVAFPLPHPPSQENDAAPETDAPTATRRAPRVGLTLVELLVVIVILTTLVTTAIPVLSPGGDDRKIREASRQINAYLSGAQSRAIRTGRPYGVALERLSSVTGNVEDNGSAATLRYVEVPAPYSGFDESSLARIAWNPELQVMQLQLVRYGRANTPAVDTLPFGYDADLIPPKFLRDGDRIETAGHSFYLRSPVPVTGGRGNDAALDTEGVFFESSNNARPLVFLLESVEGGDQGVVYHTVNNSQGASFAYNPAAPTVSSNTTGASDTFFWSSPAPYKIFRQPAPATGAPLQLPAGIAIDLRASGFSNGVALHLPSDAFHDDSNYPDGQVFSDPVLLMYSPEGTIASATFRQYTPQEILNDVPDTTNPTSKRTLVTSSLSLLIGRTELIPAEPTDNAVARWSGDPLNSKELDEPINLATDLNGLADDEQFELRNKYNWLNLESRWIILGAQSGSVSTVENAFVNPTADEDGDGTPDVDRFGPMNDFQSDGDILMLDQLVAARGNAPSRIVQGGR